MPGGKIGVARSRFRTTIDGNVRVRQQFRTLGMHVGEQFMSRVIAAGCIILMLVGFRAYIDSSKSLTGEMIGQSVGVDDPTSESDQPDTSSKSKLDSSADAKQIPTLVEFGAEWCGPCKFMAPHLKKFEEKYRGRIEVVRYDVDRDTEKAREFRISPIPAMFIVIKGKIVAQTTGGMPLEAIEKFALPWIPKESTATASEPEKTPSGEGDN